MFHKPHRTSFITVFIFMLSTLALSGSAVADPALAIADPAHNGLVVVSGPGISFVPATTNPAEITVNQARARVQATDSGYIFLFQLAGGGLASTGVGPDNPQPRAIPIQIVGTNGEAKGTPVIITLQSNITGPSPAGARTLLNVNGQSYSNIAQGTFTIEGFKVGDTFQFTASLFGPVGAAIFIPTLSVRAAGLGQPAPAPTPTIGCQTPSFADPSYLNPVKAYWLASGDFNLDGRPDLVTVNTDGPSVSLLLGDGAGSFGQPTTITGGQYPEMAAVADFNLDGKPDLAFVNTVNDRFHQSNISLLLGDGRGGFRPKMELTIKEYSVTSALAVGDFNLDGKPDLVVAFEDKNAISLLLGDGAGGFGQPQDYAGGRSPKRLAVSDFNLDGKPDVVVAGLASSPLTLLLGDGQGLSTPTFINGTNDGYALTSGDFNQDGKPDLVTAGTSVSVALRLGDGQGGFGPPQNFPAGDGIKEIAAADLNGDGRLDLAVTALHEVALLLGDGGGNFNQPVRVPLQGFPSSIIITDFNLDGQADLALSNEHRGFTLLRNTCAAAVCRGAVFAPATTLSATNPLAVAVEDFNRDGKLDLITANGVADTVSIFLGDGGGNFGQPRNFASAGNPSALIAGDFDRDGKPDVAVVNSGSNTIAVLRGDGQGGLGAATSFAAGPLPNGVAAGDFNADGKLDLVVANRQATTVSILLGDGLGGFGAPASFNVGDRAANLREPVAGDFNRDGKLDVAVGREDKNLVHVLPGNGAGGFGAPLMSVSGASSARKLIVGDFNLDGILDLATATFELRDHIFVAQGDGTGRFVFSAQFRAGGRLGALAAGDFNADGKPDLVAADENGATAFVLTGDGKGGFGQAAGFAVGSGPSALAVGDFNRDGRLDFVAANAQSNNVTVLLNLCNSTGAPVLLDSATSLAPVAGAPATSARLLTALAQNQPNETLLLTVSSDGQNFSEAATLNGVTITLRDQNPSAPSSNPNAQGGVFADVAAACVASAASFTIKATASGDVATTTTINLTVAPRTPPTLSYADQTVPFGTTPTINPTAGPSDTLAVTSIRLQSITPATGLALNVDNATGRVTVTGATLAGSYAVVIRATNNCAPGAGGFTDARFTINVTCPTITLAPTALPNGQVGTAYNQTLSITPSGGTYTFAVTQGALPAGLTLNAATGAISGTPTQSGTSSFRITATSASNCAATRDYTVTISGCPIITVGPDELPSGLVNTPYSLRVSALPAGQDYRYAVTLGELPPGLQLNPATGEISGTPTQAANVAIRITATAGQCSGYRDYTLFVGPLLGCPNLTLGALPDGVAFVRYNHTISVATPGAYRFAVTQGRLPRGWRLNGVTGQITGVTSNIGAYNFTISATSATGCRSTRAYHLVVRRIFGLP